MADGALQFGSGGYVARAVGQVLCTDGNATVVATLTLPNVEGHYHVFARVAGGNAGKSSKLAITLHAYVDIDGGAAEVTGSAELGNVGGSGYTAAITVSGLAVRVAITAANGIRAVALLEIIGVEMALTAA